MYDHHDIGKIANFVLKLRKKQVIIHIPLTHTQWKSRNKFLHQKKLKQSSDAIPFLIFHYWELLKESCVQTGIFYHDEKNKCYLNPDIPLTNKEIHFIHILNSLILTQETLEKYQSIPQKT